MVKLSISEFLVLRLIFILYLIINGISSNAQNVSEKTDFLANYLQFNVSPVLFKGYQYSGDVNNLLRRSATSSIEIGISSTRRIYNKFYLSIGAIAGVVPEKTFYNFETPKESIFSFDNPEYSSANIETKVKALIYFYYAFPFSIKMEVAKFGTNTIYVESGVRANWFLNYPFSVQYEDNYFIDSTNTATLFTQKVSQTKQIVASYFGKVGLVRPAGNRNVLGFAIVCNYSPKAIAEGEYKFFNLGFDNFGKASLSMSYIGVELSYGLQSKKNRIDRNLYK